MPQQILVIAPHPDDESIGCGGTIHLHHLRGDRIDVVFLTSGERGLAHLAAEVATATREAEAKAAGRVLGVDGIEFLHLPDGNLLNCIDEGARRLRLLMASRPPDLVYLPHPEDAHPDHKAVPPMLRRALGSRRAGPALRGYEVWTPMGWYDVVEDISAVIRPKIRAIRCHQSQIVEKYRYDQAARGLGRYRGLTTLQIRYAEVFQSLHPSPAAEAFGAAVRYLRNPSRLRRYRRPLQWFRARLRRSR